jgi:hypothetical protein
MDSSTINDSMIYFSLPQFDAVCAKQKGGGDIWCYDNMSETEKVFRSLGAPLQTDFTELRETYAS